MKKIATARLSQEIIKELTQAAGHEGAVSHVRQADPKIQQDTHRLLSLARAEQVYAWTEVRVKENKRPGRT